MLRKISKLRKKRILESSETDVYNEVYKFHKGKSVLTWNPVSKWNVSCYAHLFPKGSYPKLRTQRNNIVLVSTIQEHELLDMVFKRMKNEFWIDKLMQDVEKWYDLSWPIRVMFMVMKQWFKDKGLL